METEKLHTGLAILWAFAIGFLIRLFIFDCMIAEGQSMMPTIEPGSVLLVTKTAYGVRLPGSDIYLCRWALPKPGDVVVFWTPEGAVAVKRCASIADKRSFIALGDNQLLSLDSRSYGPVPVNQIIGKVLNLKKRTIKQGKLLQSVEVYLCGLIFTNVSR
jgi:signal peptidase I